MVFSLASGNIAGAFEIVTTNNSIGEIFVARPLDREELDQYILKVGSNPFHPKRAQPISTPWWSASHITKDHGAGGTP